MDNFDYLLNENSESDEDIKIEMTNYKNGISQTQTYTVPYAFNAHNEKRLICFSVIYGSPCQYGAKCAYAHSLAEQKIDDDKKYIYQIIFDKNMMNFFSLVNPKTEEIYKNLLFLTNICDNCRSKKCTGGYNCRNGACSPCFKICKNDLLTGECLNKVVDIQIDQNILSKLEDGQQDPTFTQCDKYRGCLNGHHLSEHGIIPYYKYVHQKENSKKNKYQSFRYIDIDPLSRIFRTDNQINNLDLDYDDSTTDEEINNWFQKSDSL